VLRGEFVEHLTRKGVLHGEPPLEAGRGAGRLDTGAGLDWLARTKLSPAMFADELATFYACRRVEKTELAGRRFAGADLSPRFLKEGRLFPYADEQGTLTLAIAAPLDGETIRAIEIALGGQFAIAVATGEDIDFALMATQDAAAAPASSAEFSEPSSASSDELDDLRDLARGAPIVRALDDPCGSRSISAQPTCISNPLKGPSRSAFASMAS